MRIIKDIHGFEIVSQPYLCTASLLEIVLKSESKQNVSQVEIADYFGVNFPLSKKESTIQAEIKNFNFVDDPNKYGIVIKGNMINDFFAYHNVNLKEVYYPINRFMDWEFEDFLNKTKSIGKYIIVGYDYGKLYNDKASKVGHVSIISGVSDNIVEIYDPGPDSPGYKNIDMNRLFVAIKAKNDGLWIFS